MHAVLQERCSLTRVAHLLGALDAQAHVAVVVTNHNKGLQTQAGMETTHVKQGDQQ
jgi:hypothetical protein